MANFGETLRRERELRKISLREVSEATKIGLRYLEALEENRFDQLPGGLFNKGFIRAYAKFIGLDGETLVNVYLYDQAHQQKTTPARPRSAVKPEDSPLPKPAAPAPVLWRRFPVKLITGIALALFMVGAAGWLFLFRVPAGTAIDTAPTADEPPIQQAGLLRPAPQSSQAVPEPAAAQQETPLASPAPSDPPEAAPPAASEKAPPIETDLALFLGTTQTTAIVIVCDGVEKVRRDLGAGETIAVSCRGQALLTAGNAGALSLKINGNECFPLGELGAALEEFPLNVKRAMVICPPEKEVP